MIASEKTLNTEITFAKAALCDMPALLSIRARVISAVFGSKSDDDMVKLIDNTFAYLTEHFEEQATILATDYLNNIIACGSVCFYDLLPTPDNPTGKKAYLMNMYTEPKYRRRGLATKIIDMLLSEARERGVTHIGLDASNLGRRVYEKYGFTSALDEMNYCIDLSGKG